MRKPAISNRHSLLQVSWNGTVHRQSNDAGKPPSKLHTMRGMQSIALLYPCDRTIALTGMRAWHIFGPGGDVNNNYFPMAYLIPRFQVFLRGETPIRFEITTVMNNTDIEE